MSLNVFDIVILVILVFSFVRGFMKGFFIEVASLIAIFLGAYAAINYSGSVELFLKESVLEWSDQTFRIVSFALTFLTIVIIVITIGKILTKLADITALGLANKLMGGVFSVLKSALILSIIFVFFGRVNDTLPFVKEKTLNESTFYHPIKEIAPTLFPSIIKKEKDGTTKFDLTA
ncbi:MAG: CvpA family protein [Polaribacter sp.]